MEARKENLKNSPAPTSDGIDEHLIETAAEFQQLPPEEQRAIAAYSKFFAGPLPPPEMLEKYDAIVPGCASTIISNMIDESNHRRNIENKSLDAGARYTKSGLIMAFVIAILGIGMGFSVALLVLFLADGWSQVAGILAGTALSGVSIVALVRKFIDGPRSEQQEESKAESDTQIENE